ncbi:MAG: hypothetical protein RIB58_03725 [Phycisphaerales bacterium]|jgi:hypothetical protein
MDRRVLGLLSLLVCLLGLGGCVQPGRGDVKPAAARFVVPVEAYATVFEAAGDELTRRRFEVDRVDARSGVIRSLPKSGAGLLAPWTLPPGARVVEDTFNAQSRVVEIRFEAAEAGVVSPSGVASPLADPGLPLLPAQAAESVVVSVRVLVSRRVTPTRRLDSTAIRSSTNSVDPSLFRRGLGTRFEAPQDLDADAASQIARGIARRVGVAISTGQDSGRRDRGGGAGDE